MWSAIRPPRWPCGFAQCLLTRPLPSMGSPDSAQEFGRNLTGCLFYTFLLRVGAYHPYPTQGPHFHGDHFTRRVLVGKTKRNDGESWINCPLGRVWAAKFADVHCCAWHEQLINQFVNAKAWCASKIKARLFLLFRS